MTIAQKVRERIKRLFLGYDPEWEGAVAGYAVNYLGKHAWRVGREMDLDDLLQEAYIKFLELQERYEYETPAHFMAVWKSALHNWIINLAKLRTRRREQPLGKLEVVDRNPGIDWHLHVLEAPPAVRVLLRAVDGRQRKLPMRKAVGHRETTNQYLCRLAGVPDTTPLRRMFKLWLKCSR